MGPLAISAGMFVTVVAVVGFVSVGDVAKTSEPVPVSSVTAAARFALLGVARNVATFAPSPDTPVLIGSPVHEVNVPLLGVPSVGAVSTREVRVLLVRVTVLVGVTVMSDKCATVPSASWKVMVWLSVGACLRVVM